MLAFSSSSRKNNLATLARCISWLWTLSDKPKDSEWQLILSNFGRILEYSRSNPHPVIIILSCIWYNACTDSACCQTNQRTGIANWSSWEVHTLCPTLVCFCAHATQICPNQLPRYLVSAFCVSWSHRKTSKGKVHQFFKWPSDVWRHRHKHKSL